MSLAMKCSATRNTKSAIGEWGNFERFFKVFIQIGFINNLSFN